MEIAHIVNPVRADPSSDLFTAQPIAFETMRRARALAAPQISVRLFSTQFTWDDVPAPDAFERAPDLDRSVLDVAEFRVPRQLPLLSDILDRLYYTSAADYFVYTNVDIALQPHFYLSVCDFIQRGYESFTINRRTIDGRYSVIEELDEMYAEPGTAHRGWDCFVFPRYQYSKMILKNICLGTGRVGLALVANLVALSQNFNEFRDEHLTFHIGDRCSWLNRTYADYYSYNTAELMNILSELEMEHGHFPRESIPGVFLRRQRLWGPLYDLWSRYVRLPVGLSRYLNQAARR